MSMPTDVPIIDTMLGVPQDEQTRSYDFFRMLLRDEESKKQFDFPVQYIFKDFPKVEKQEDYITYTLKLMDTHGIERAMTGVSLDDPSANNNRAVMRPRPGRWLRHSTKPSGAEVESKPKKTPPKRGFSTQRSV